ncbi:GDP-mannose-dependent alpha-(1-2)-phosphatidylinositol mannosyltransferase [Peptococcaceae bacterium CEB3]|nr:GDP-mannose-dependent alpha-(1-2)-phosphatidylinositol mannosyltransferase [Peptococcaceae bacterium CEB3]
MKIIIPVLSLETGGGARFLYQLANALADRGHSVEIVIPQGAVIAWPLRVKVRRVAELTAPFIPSGDFILPNFYPTVMPAWEAKKGRVVRLSLVYEPLILKDVAEISRSTYLIDAPILTISEWQRQIVLHEIGRDSTVIHGGADSSVFHPYAKQSRQSGRKAIFYILRGSLYTWKGNEDFFQAIERLKPRFSDFDVTVVAPEGLAPTDPVFHLVKQAQTDEHMARLYGKADLFVYTSYYEAFGLPPLEAMACGTAVVTTDCGGTRDYTRSGENCRVVPPSDIGLLTDAIFELLTDDAQREHLALNGYLQAQTRTWQRTAAEVERFLRSL